MGKSDYTYYTSDIVLVSLNHKLSLSSYFLVTLLLKLNCIVEDLLLFSTYSKLVLVGVTGSAIII